MILLLDTSTDMCKLSLMEGEHAERQYHDEWKADRDLAKSLPGYIKDQLNVVGKTLNDLTGIGVYQGPGSFTGLRIGITVLNTIADSQQIPIVGEQGVSWKEQSMKRLWAGENDKVVMPFYGSEANITTPRK